jgi:hypothetical protein
LTLTDEALTLPAHSQQLGESKSRAPILGLNLMFLLVENRLAELHSEVGRAVLRFVLPVVMRLILTWS